MARLRASAGVPAHAGGDDRLRATAVLLLMLLDQARDARLWELMHDCRAAEAVLALHEQAPAAPPATVRQLLDGVHTMKAPLARAAASFVHAVREFPGQHPLLSPEASRP